MTSHPTSGRTTSPDPDDAFPSPQFPNTQGPPSIISSRMTDIASDDGNTTQPPASGSPKKPGVDVLSQPGTVKTAASGSQAWRQPQSLRKNYVTSLAAKRGSTGATSIASSRPTSSRSRSHVPSLTSHAFFHPLSSQKLQAQRGGAGASRPSALSQGGLNDAPQETTESTADGGQRQSIISNPMAGLDRRLTDDGEMRAPPSRGTEFTEQETLDRITANTSPTHGHTATGSVTDSVRPLQQKKPTHLNIRLDRENRGTLPTPSKSPRSFRSSFLMPGRSGDGQSTPNRVPPGAEKLSSNASSPRLNPVNPGKPADTSNLTAANTNAGYVFQYFEGNTVFCLGGRFQNTRHRPVNIATGLIIVIPAVLFFIFSAPWLWDNISPAIPIAFAYVFYICISSFIHASASDPGVSIVPPMRRRQSGTDMSRSFRGISISSQLSRTMTRCIRTYQRTTGR